MERKDKCEKDKLVKSQGRKKQGDKEETQEDFPSLVYNESTHSTHYIKAVIVIDFDRDVPTIFTLGKSLVSVDTFK